MLRICSRHLARMGKMKPCPSVTPVAAALVAGRHLSQQSTLPSLPVPPLKQTCELYLSFLEPIVEPHELKHTEKLMEDFLKPGGVGERLQRSLENKASNTDNWLTELYIKCEFLDKRKPLTVFSNHGTVLPNTNFRNKQEQIRFAAEFSSSLLKANVMVENDTVPMEYMGGRLLCMKQYSQALSSCCIPGLKTDSLVYHAKTPNTPKHISVVHNGQFFVLDVYNNDGTLLTADQMYVQLERICEASPHATMEPVGILTTQYRDIWSRTYNCLIQDETNRDSLSAIERSIFMVCLDNAKPRKSNELRQSAILQILHGGGSQFNSGNRWFDKGLQIIIGEDGTCGANGLHSAADGTVCMGLGDLTMTIMMEPKTSQPPEKPLPMPQKLHFNITPEIKEDIEEAKQHIDKMVQDLTLRITTFKHFGKNALKALKLSPDAFVQMAIQLAYYRMHRQCCPTFEPASLRMFKLGRVAAIHSNSKASGDFVKAFDDPNIKNSEKADLLKKAIKMHKWYTNMVVRGQGLEGHLLGLQLQAEEENIPMPELFRDTSFTKAFDYQISTSQVISKTNCLPCVGPETPDMYDVCYSILNNHISLIVSRFEPPNTCKETCAERMIEVMVDAFLDMRRMLEHQEAV